MKLLAFALSLFLILPTSYGKNLELKISTVWKMNDSTKSSETRVIAELGKEFILPLEGLDSHKLIMTADVLKSKANSNAAPTELIKLKSKVVKSENGKDQLLTMAAITTKLKQVATIKKESRKDGHIELNILPVKFVQK